MTLAAFRDDGFWTLVWQICSFALKRGRLKSFPPRAFVGRASLSYPATVHQLSRLSSIRMYRNRYIPAAPRWRLTCEWETPQPAQLPPRYGHFWGRFGRPKEDVGEGIFDPSRTSITLKSSRSTHHHYRP